MKAAVINQFGEPDVFEITELETPEIKVNELLVEAKGGSLNPIDWKQRRGNHRFLFGANFPIVLGYDVSGIVVKTGSAVKNFKVKDEVCGVLNNTYGGGLGQFVKGEEKCFSQIVKPVSLTESAVLPLAGLTALQALRDKAKITKGKKLLLIGAAGGVGHYALQIAKLFGADVHAISSRRHKDFIQKLVDCTFIDYEEENVSDLPDRFDIIFDTIGKYPFPKYKHLLRPGGIHVNILPRPKILYYKIISLFTKGKRARSHLMKHKPDDLKLLMKWVAEGKLKLCIEKEFELEQISEAHAFMEEGHTEGKILIRY
jgi:NADPH:quinone reductase-like Zn-dependent oxidoreductase